MIFKILVKLPDREKLTLNELNDAYLKDHCFGDFPSDHKNAAFILVRGFYLATCEVDDFRPVC